MKLDVLIKNGHVYDVAANIDQVMDIGIADGLLVFPDSTQIEANEIIDAGNHYILPGLIDFHTHLFYGGSGFGANPNLLFAAGVTRAVDGGTTGCANFEAFYRQTQLVSQLPVKYMLHLAPIGQPGYGVQEAADPASWNEPAIHNLIEKYPDDIIGLKLRIGKPMLAERGLVPLQKACEMAQRVGRPLCVHVTDSTLSAAEIADTLQPGDIYCHVYHGKGNTILDDSGAVLPALRNAAERGVVMDAANGSINFSYPIARVAIEQGFYPDIISSDITPTTLNRGNNAKNLSFIMSKYLALGMPFKEVIRAVTQTPAKLMGLEGVAGTLMAGMKADFVVMEKLNGMFSFADCDKREFTGTEMLSPLLTVSQGKLVFRQTYF